MSKETLITGASGFVGRNLTQYFDDHKVSYQCCSLRSGVDPVVPLLEDVASIIHLAGVAHQFAEISDEEYFHVNCSLPVALATKAKEAGVQHFIYLSSVKVYGESAASKILDERSACKPVDAYGKSKLQAEQALLALNDDAFCVSIIRPVLVYGPGVKGNLAQLIKLFSKRRLMVFPRIKNRRSMVNVGKLCRMIALLIEKRLAGIFIASDIGATSSYALAEAIAKQKGCRLLPLPGVKLLGLALYYFKRPVYDRLFGSFEFDSSCSDLMVFGSKADGFFAEGIRQMCDSAKQCKESDAK